MHETQWSALITNAHTFGVDAISPPVMKQILINIERFEMEKHKDILKKREERAAIEAARIARDNERKQRIEEQQRQDEKAQRDLKCKKMNEWKEKLRISDRQKAKEKKELISLAAKKGSQRQTISFPNIIPLRTKPAQPVVAQSVAPAVVIPRCTPRSIFVRSFVPKTTCRLTKYNKSVRLAACIYSKSKLV